MIPKRLRNTKKGRYWCQRHSNGLKTSARPKEIKKHHKDMDTKWSQPPQMYCKELKLQQRHSSQRTQNLKKPFKKQTQHWKLFKVFKCTQNDPFPQKFPKETQNYLKVTSERKKTFPKRPQSISKTKIKHTSWPQRHSNPLKTSTVSYKYRKGAWNIHRKPEYKSWNRQKNTTDRIHVYSVSGYYLLVCDIQCCLTLNIYFCDEIHWE